jgi:hypothetical protein
MPVLPLVEIPIHDTLLGEKTAPQVIAVTAEQGVVQIEKRKTHRHFLL